MNNSSLKKRLLSVAMAAVMVFSLLPATAWAAMAENLSAASGQTRTEQKRGGSDTYTVTRDVKSVAAARSWSRTAAAPEAPASAAASSAT